MPYLTVIEFGTESMYIMQTTQTREMLARSQRSALDTRTERCREYRETVESLPGSFSAAATARTGEATGYAEEKETEKEIHYLLLPTEGGSRSF
jgi:hypothetical protein